MRKLFPYALLAALIVVPMVLLQRDLSSEKDVLPAIVSKDDFSNVAPTGFPMFSLYTRSLDSGDEPVDQACPPKKPYSRESDEILQKKKRALVMELAKTNDPEYLLAAAVFAQSDDLDESLNLLKRAARGAPMNTLVVWNQLTMCRSSKSASCDLEKIIANAVHVDGSNGALWLEVAMLRLVENDPDAAATAIRQAIAASRFDNHFMEQALVLARALAVRGNLSYSERILEGIGYSAAMTLSYYGILGHCRKLSEGAGVWVDLCDQIGSKMFADGQTSLDKMVGLNLQKVAASHAQDDARAKTAAARLQQIKDEYGSLFGAMEVSNLLANDEAVLNVYVDNVLTYGELEAQKRLLVEVDRLKQTSGFDRCKLVNGWTGY